MADNIKNKYIQKLQKYINDAKEKNGVIKMSHCAKLRKKAEELETEKNLELFHLINTSKNVNLKKVEYLLETGANVNAKFKDGLTPYMLASLNAQLEVLDLLKQEGANIEARTNFGQNALMFACLIRDNYDVAVKRKYLKVVKKLMEHGVGNNMHVDNVGLTRDDYLLGNTDPFTKTYLDLIESYINAGNEEVVVLEK